MTLFTAQQGVDVSLPERRERFRSMLIARGYHLDIGFDADRSGNSMVVTGTVPSYHFKQIVLNCAKRSSDGILVVDRLDVHSPPRFLGSPKG